MTNLADLRELSLNDQEEVRSEAFGIKPLTSEFQNFGEALFNWQNSDGVSERKSKIADSFMVHAFCTANQLRYSRVNLAHYMRQNDYFEDDQWVYDFIREHSYFGIGGGIYFKTDAANRPISYLRVTSESQINVNVEIAGVESLTMLLREAAKENLCIENSELKASYSEVLLMKLSGSDTPILTTMGGVIQNSRQSKPEYYPYIDGGLEALIKQFMESEETVLILMGPPGTGKSSIVAAAAEVMNLHPIYAKKSDVILHQSFVSYVCRLSDEMMAKVDGTKAKSRIDLYKKRSVGDVEYPALGHLSEDEEQPRAPLIVIENADALIAPRSQGNLHMADLLNETDGIGANHTRKLLFATNLTSTKAIDEALLRPGRCYAVVNCRLLTPDEAVAARKAAGLPDFTEYPKEDISLAEALRKPMKKITIEKVKSRIGFGF